MQGVDYSRCPQVSRFNQSSMPDKVYFELLPDGYREEILQEPQMTRRGKEVFINDEGLFWRKPAAISEQGFGIDMTVFPPWPGGGLIIRKRSTKASTDLVPTRDRPGCAEPLLGNPRVSPIFCELRTVASGNPGRC